MPCTLDQAFGGFHEIKVKKKNKKNKGNQEILYPGNIKSIDDNFGQTSRGIAPFDGTIFNYGNEYYPVGELKNFEEFNKYSHTSRVLGPQEEVQEMLEKPETKKVIVQQQLKPNKIQERNQDEEHLRTITDEEYAEYIKLKQERHHMIHNRPLEGFDNVNDDFNDVLLFGIMGIFFLLLIDYIYKMGKRSY